MALSFLPGYSVKFTKRFNGACCVEGTPGARDDEGRPYTVRYEAVNAMLLNEFLKEHKKVEEQASKIERLEAALEKMSGRLDAKGL